MLTPYDPRLTAYVLGELEPAERQTVEAAIAESAELQQAVFELEKTSTLLKTSFAAEHSHGPLESCVSSAVVASREVKPKATARRRIASISWIVAATLIVGTLGTLFWLTNASHRNNTPLALRNSAEMEQLFEQMESEERGIAGKLDDLTTILDTSSSSMTDAAAIERGLRGHSLNTDLAPQTTGESASAGDSTAEVAGGGQTRSYTVMVPYPESDGSLTVQQQSRTRDLTVAQQVPDGGTVLMGGINREPIAQLYGQSGDQPDAQKTSELEFPSTEFWEQGKARRKKYESSRLSPEIIAGDRYDPIIENAFLSPRESPLSTFSIDVDTASYSKVRSYLKNYQQLPPPGAVRIEELVNYFPYSYAPPVDDTPFAAHQSVVACPWNPEHRLVRVALKGREIPQEKRPLSNLVFLLDVSGSMNESNRLPLVKRGIEMLINQLGENDRVAMVVYAGAAGLVLDSTTGDQKTTLLGALERLSAGGSTNGGDGIRLAYQLAQDNFITGGINRVILCTDGDFNVGTTSTDELVGLVEEKARGNVFLTVLGFGMGNLNDAMLEQISNRGNGTYAFIDTDHEAHKVMVEQLSGTLQTIAKDVKIQIEFNPARVAAYRLIGYENRILAAEDFNNDRKDAGEIGAGHTVTALYEIVPAGSDAPGSAPAVDDLKYQARLEDATVAEDNGELLTLKLRYKQPEGSTSQLLEFPLVDGNRPFSEADRDFQFAAAVAAFGMKLRGSQHAGTITWPAILEIAQAACGADAGGYRTEFVELVRAAAAMMGNR